MATTWTGLQGWPPAPRLTTDRLLLEPLRVEHADEMAGILDDPDLHAYIGGDPATVDQLRSRYAQQVAGRSTDGSQRWHNWILRRRDTGAAVGTLQTTVTAEQGRSVAEVAWVVAVPAQGLGFAREGARAMIWWLRHQGVEVLVAHVHPEHAASMAVARAVGLEATDVVVDGEVRWEG